LGSVWTSPKYRFQSPLWRDFVGKAVPERLEVISNCGQFYRELVDVDRNPLGFATLSCADRSLCPNCANAYRVEAAADTIEVFEALFRGMRVEPKVVPVVFTLPKEYRRLVSSDPLGIQRFRQACWQTLKFALGDGITSVITYQDWSSRDPLSPADPHCHCLVPLVRLCDSRFENHRLVSGGFESIPERLPERWFRADGETREHSELVSIVGRESISKYYKDEVMSRWGSCYDPRVWDWHWGLWKTWANFWSQMRHSLLYQFRKPVRDIENQLRHHRMPVAFDVGRARELLLHRSLCQGLPAVEARSAIEARPASHPLGATRGRRARLAVVGVACGHDRSQHVVGARSLRLACGFPFCLCKDYRQSVERRSQWRGFLAPYFHCRSDALGILGIDCSDTGDLPNQAIRRHRRHLLVDPETNDPLFFGSPEPVAQEHVLGSSFRVLSRLREPGEAIRWGEDLGSSSYEDGFD